MNFQLWDASTGQEFSQYNEHEKRAWSVDFSPVCPTKFASGSDDGTVKLWSISEVNPLPCKCMQECLYKSRLTENH